MEMDNDEAVTWLVSMANTLKKRFPQDDLPLATLLPIASQLMFVCKLIEIADQVDAAGSEVSGYLADLTEHLDDLTKATRGG